MAGRICIFLLRNSLTAALAGLLFAVGAVRANDLMEHDNGSVIEPELQRRTITEADIDSEDFEAGAYAGVMSIEDFGTNFVYGVRAAYHITEDFFVEAAYGRTEANETSYETLSGGAKLLTTAGRNSITTTFHLATTCFQAKPSSEAGMPSIRRSMSLPVSAIPSSPMTATLRSMAEPATAFCLPTGWRCMSMCAITFSNPTFSAMTRPPTTWNSRVDSLSFFDRRWL